MIYELHARRNALHQAWQVLVAHPEPPRLDDTADDHPAPTGHRGHGARADQATGPTGHNLPSHQRSHTACTGERVELSTTSEILGIPSRLGRVAGGLATGNLRGTQHLRAHRQIVTDRSGGNWPHRALLRSLIA